MNKRKINVLAMYRGDILANRGTPIRVRSLLARMDRNANINLSVCSWSVEPEYFKKHFMLKNEHWNDLKKIYKYVKDNNIDVVVGHTISTSYFLLPIKIFTKAKLVLEMHGFIEEEAREYNSMSLFAYYRMKVWNAIFFFFCDFITTCSKSITDIILKYNKNVVSMCGGVNIDIFNPNAKSEGYFKRDGRVVIGYIGDSKKWQGIDFLIDTYRELLKRDKDFRLVLLMSENKNIPNDMEVFGPLPHEDVPKFMIDCDILVIPRPLTRVTKISYPSKLTEYLAMGKAVVVSNMGDADQVVIDGVNGMLYTPGDREALIDKFLLLKDKSTRVNLGREANKTAQAMSWSRMSKTFTDYIINLF